MAKLDVLKFYIVSLILRLGLFINSLLLIFGDFEPRCSYKIVLIKKECIKFAGSTKDYIKLDICRNRMWYTNARGLEFNGAVGFCPQSGCCLHVCVCMFRFLSLFCHTVVISRTLITLSVKKLGSK